MSNHISPPFLVTGLTAGSSPTILFSVPASKRKTEHSDHSKRYECMPQTALCHWTNLSMPFIQCCIENDCSCVSRHWV